MKARHAKTQRGPATPRSSPAVPPARWTRWILPVALVVFAAIAYGPAVSVPFIGDDYVFLDKTRHAGFGALWSFRNTDFGWYRPWSRELHFWTLQHLAGAHEPAFRVVSLVLWLGFLALYHDFARRIAGARIAVLATLGAAGLSLWGAPLTWISGTQDLWMLVFVTLTLVLLERGLIAWAPLAYLLALLSKETAVVTPVIVLAHARELAGLSRRAALLRVLPFVLVTVVWFAFHPALRHRLTHPIDPVTTGEKVHGPLAILGSSLLTLVNADKITLPRDPKAMRTLATVASALVLAAAAWITLARARDRRDPPVAARLAVARFGLLWCIVGWLPLFQRSIGWHAYYGGLGALGAWLVIASGLARWPRIATVALLALGLLRGAAAATRSWDWGSEWYQSRAGNMLRLIRGQLLALHPKLPQHTRLYFGNIPNNIGLVAGRSPAVRVWYDDPTLAGGFYSYYRARRPGEPVAPDLFFHFDSTSGIREVFADGRPDPVTGRRDATWEDVHGKLAMTFVSNGDFLRAATLLDSLATLRHRNDAAMFAAVCREVAGDSVRAAQGYAEVLVRTGGTRQQVADWRTRLLASMPRETRRVQ